ncbi:MAG: PEP-CTERM sorting domain-containing protein [Planctomyces sp.]|nr:PEP-CTERM sorting domain-containing protein [Planctomyces sp.]
MKQIAVLLTAIALVGLGQTAQGATLVTWDFNDDNAVPDGLHANLASTNFLDGASLSNVVINDNAAARGWNPSGTAAAALAAGDYWTFTVTAAAGYVFDLDALSFDKWRGSMGPVSTQVYLGATLTGTAGTVTTSSTGYSTDLSSFTGLTSAQFFIVAWGASSNGVNANLFVDNVLLTGALREIDDGNGNGGGTDPNPVPEPGSMALLGLGGLGLAGWRRRKANAAKA